MIVSINHGILTGRTDGAWSGAFADYLGREHGNAVPLLKSYFEWPLPRLAAVRNLARVVELTDSARRNLVLHQAKRGRRMEFAAVGHSNGCVLAFGVCENLIGNGIPVRSLVLMCPALRTKETTRKIADWLNRGMLGRAVLVRATGDRTIGVVARFRAVSWPWGSLGLDGWDLSSLDEIGLEAMPAEMHTIDLAAEGHGDLLDLGRREETFRSLVAPALGLGGGDTFFEEGGVMGR